MFCPHVSKDTSLCFELGVSHRVKSQLRKKGGSVAALRGKEVYAASYLMFLLQTLVHLTARMDMEVRMLDSDSRSAFRNFQIELSFDRFTNTIDLFRVCNLVDLKDIFDPLAQRGDARTMHGDA